jgi:hypothetical protein
MRLTDHVTLNSNNNISTAEEFMNIEKEFSASLIKLIRGVKLTTHLELVPRLRKCGSIHALPHMPSWRSA